MISAADIVAQKIKQHDMEKKHTQEKIIYVNRVPDLDLPDSLYREILDVVNDGKLISSPLSFEYNNKKGTNWFQKLLATAGFGKKGKLAIYRLPDSTRHKIEHHYRPIIDRLGQPYKIRVKSTLNARFLLPHSDKFLFDGPTADGDSCSISIGVVTHGERTCFYKWPIGFRYRLRDYLRLQRQAMIQMQPREAFLYNNQALHGVFGCDQRLVRHILTISWETVDIQDLYAAVVAEYRDHA